MDGFTQTDQVNVLGEPLQTCCTSPMTGYYRTGCCEVGGDDTGVHAVCAIMTDDFLEFSKNADVYKRHFINHPAKHLGRGETPDFS